ncbi:MAG: hypothetical protein V1859_01315 [archaeon]
MPNSLWRTASVKYKVPFLCNFIVKTEHFDDYSLNSNQLKSGCKSYYWQTINNTEYCFNNADDAGYCLFDIGSDEPKIYFDCSKITRISSREFCFFLLADEKDDINFCDKIVVSGTQMKDRCFYNIAVGTKNKVLCDRILNTDDRDICYYYAR